MVLGVIGIRADPPRDRARAPSSSSGSSLWVLVTIAVRRAVARVRAAAVGRHPPGGDVGARRRSASGCCCTIFGGLIVLADRRLPRADATGTRRGACLRTSASSETLTRLLPDTLYREASLRAAQPAGDRPSRRPATLGQYAQAQQRIPSLFSLDQSFLLVWPQMVTLVALTVACFALAYVLFMRQEVRA